MAVFANYAHYYDLLYQDKDYQGETEFVHRLLQSHAPKTTSILELGCGTGKHACLLAEKGYQICGIDLSQEMLEQADQRLADLPAEQVARLKFAQGDVQTVRLDQMFDAVISLFHVVSYQTTNADLNAMFTTAATHVKPGGIFLFDCWYGPAVLTDRPTVRVKRLQDEKITVTRIAEPVMDANANLVDVNYQVFVRDRKTDWMDECRETHRMRYLFQPEIELLCGQHGFELVASGEWMTDQALGFETWGAYFIGRR